jgi:predicted nucleic acid-binding protein
MAATYFIDTCIWRDFYENRISISGRHLGKEASELFMLIIRKKDRILYSETLIWELKKDYQEHDIKSMLNFLFLGGILQHVEISKEEYEQARKISEERALPFVDCLNAIQARNHNAIMVSQDRHFTVDLNDIIRTKRPSEIN